MTDLKVKDSSLFVYYFDNFLFKSILAAGSAIMIYEPQFRPSCLSWNQNPSSGLLAVSSLIYQKQNYVDWFYF